MPAISSLVRGLVVALMVSQTSAHFILNYPQSIGFDDDLEGTAPCGSFSVDFSTNNVTEFHVGGDAISLRSTHPDTMWLLRATLGTPDSGNWTSVSPVIAQSSLGNFCRSDITVPESFAGQNGTIGIAANGPDGLLYQCAAVSFVAGAATAVPSSCTNSTGVTATYTTDSGLSSLPASSTPTSDSISSGTPAATSSSAASANGLASYSYTGLGSLIWVGVVGSATFLACLL